MEQSYEKLLKAVKRISVHLCDRCRYDRGVPCTCANTERYIIQLLESNEAKEYLRKRLTKTPAAI